MAACSLRNATTVKKLCALERDNYAIGGFWITADEKYVTITMQKLGERARGQISVSRRVFDRLIDFYQKDQEPPRG